MDGGADRLISAADSSPTTTPPISTAEVDVDVDIASSSVAAVDSAADSSPPSDDDASPPLDAAAAVVSEVDLRAKIIKQAEYYFSDENLPTDKFLMKYMKKDKEGFGHRLEVSPGAPILLWRRRLLVPISVIATFRKMRRLSKGSAIVDALKESSQLVVSSDGKKVKRLHPLPSIETIDPKFCTVVVENLPEDRSTENIRRIFGQVRSIKSISVHDPQVTGDANGTKAEKLISSKLHALIEYETELAAEQAVVTLNDETDWRNGLRVQLLRKRMGLGLGKKAPKGSDSEKGGHDRVPVSKKGEKNQTKEKKNDDPVDEEGNHASKEKNGLKGRNRSKGRKQRGNNGMGHGTTSAVEPSKPPPGPSMPDGTRGFTMGRGRPLVSQ